MSDDPTPPRGDLDQAIGLLRGQVEEEFKISERLDSKSRQAFAVALGYFAVVQTMSFGAFAAAQVTGADRVFLGLGAAAAGIAVLVVGHRLMNGEEARAERDIEPETVIAWADEAGGDPDYVPSRLLRALADLVEDRSSNNRARASAYDRVAGAARWAFIVTSVQLLVAVMVRL